MKKILLLLLMLFIPFFINAEELKLEWIKTPDENTMTFVNSAIQSNNGDIIVAGQMNDKSDWRFMSAVIAKMNQNGNIIWSDNHPNSRSSFLVVHEFDNGDIIAIGNEFNDINEGIIKKYDIDGNILWETNWGDTGRSDFNSSIKLNNEEFVVAGYAYSNDINSDDAFVVKYDTDGNILWQKYWGGTESDAFLSMIQTTDGGLIAVGYSASTNIDELSNKGERDAIIVKYDNEGNVLWQKSWGGTDRDEFYGVVQTADGGLIAVGHSPSTDIEGLQNNGFEDAIIVKYDNEGNILWQKSFGGTAFDQFNSVMQTTDGGAIAVGETRSTDIEGLENKGDSDAIIIKYDKNGNIQWQYVWGGNADDFFKKTTKISNGEIIVVGNSYSTDIEELSNEGESMPFIAKYTFEYDLENVVVENENGTSTIKQEGTYGIKTPTPDKGYEVDQIIIKDKDGNILDIATTKLEDGTYSFPLYTDVSVEVTFKLKIDNPKTGILNYGAILSLFMILPILVLIYICRYNQKYGL